MKPEGVRLRLRHLCMDWSGTRTWLKDSASTLRAPAIKRCHGPSAHTYSFSHCLHTYEYVQYVPMMEGVRSLTVGGHAIGCLISRAPVPSWISAPLCYGVAGRTLKQPTRKPREQGTNRQGVRAAEPSRRRRPRTFSGRWTPTLTVIPCCVVVRARAHACNSGSRIALLLPFDS